MELHLWISFALASLAMGLLPGPGVLSIVGYAVSAGRRVALASVAGLALGNVTAMTLSLAGVGALLAASALAFTLLKWAGALYLIGLGIAMIVRSKPVVTSEGTAPIAITARAAFVGNLAVGTFHPKTIVFFVAFVPQFISPEMSYMLQSTILVATFTAIVGVTDTLYALGASRAARLLVRPRAALWTKRAGGGVMVAAGVATAAARN